MEIDFLRLYHIFAVIDFTLVCLLNGSTSDQVSMICNYLLLIRNFKIVFINLDLIQENLEKIMDIINEVRITRIKANKQIENIYEIVNRMNAKWSLKYH